MPDSSCSRTSARVAFMCERKPTFGMRRCSGIWPPSKPTLWQPPLRARWPLTPRPQVLPWPAEAPRPTRRRGLREPAVGLMLFRRMSVLLHFQQVAGDVHHAAVLRRVCDHHALMHPAQPQAPHRGGDVLQLAVHAAGQRDGDLLAARMGSWLRGLLSCRLAGWLANRCAGRLADFLAHAHQALPRMSSTLLPRLAAMSSGERTLASAFTVARTTLIGLREP